MVEWLKQRFNVLEVFNSISQRVNRYESAIIVLHNTKYIITNLLDTEEYSVATMDATFIKRIKGQKDFKEFMLELSK